MNKLTQTEFSQWRKRQKPITLLDVRRAEKRVADGHDISGAVWQDPALWLDWKDSIPKNVPAVLYCVHGREISQALATALRVLGVQAYYLEGGWADAVKWH